MERFSKINSREERITRNQQYLHDNRHFFHQGTTQLSSFSFKCLPQKACEALPLALRICSTGGVCVFVCVCLKAGLIADKDKKE